MITVFSNLAGVLLTGAGVAAALIALLLEELKGRRALKVGIVTFCAVVAAFGVYFSVRDLDTPRPLVQTVVVTSVVTLTPQPLETAVGERSIEVTRIVEQPITVTRIVEQQIEVTREATRLVPVTVTPSPSDTPPPVLSLDVDQTFANQGAELTLSDPKLETDRLMTTWRFVNNTGQQLSLKFSKENFSAFDNQGRKVDPGNFHCVNAFPCGTFEKVLAPGERVENMGYDGLWTPLDTSDCSITEITFVVRNFTLRIPEARWRVPIKLC